MSLVNPRKEVSCNDDGNCVHHGGSFSKPEDFDDGDYNTTIIFLGTFSEEGVDRDSLSFGQEANDMVSDFAKYNRANGKKTIVVMTTPGAVLTPWRDDVDAIILHFYPGEMAAQSAFDILFGLSNPSGKLPITLPVGENDQ